MKSAIGILPRLITTGWRSSATLDLPMMRRLTEYSPSCVRMPARMAGIRKRVCKMPVTRPASMPASTANSSESSGCMPDRISTALTAPPVQRLLSTVRSAMSSSLYVT